MVSESFNQTISSGDFQLLQLTSKWDNCNDSATTEGTHRDYCAAQKFLGMRKVLRKVTDNYSSDY